MGLHVRRSSCFFQFSSMGERGKALKHLGDVFCFQVLSSTNVFLKIFPIGVWFFNCFESHITNFMRIILKPDFYIKNQGAALMPTQYCPCKKNE